MTELHQTINTPNESNVSISPSNLNPFQLGSGLSPFSAGPGPGISSSVYVVSGSTTSRRARILSIDGGGIRGIIPACVLVAQEAATGKLTRENYDFVAGTSTGALIAAAVAAGVPATRILDIYVHRAKEIFRPNDPVAATALRGLRGWAYDPANIQHVMETELGPAARWQLNDSPIGILLTATAMNGKPYYFVKDGERNSQKMGRIGLVNAAVASSAAPTYFHPWTIPGIGVLVDGGLGVAGNPCYQACVEAFDYDTFKPAVSDVISLGTGYSPRGLDVPATLIGWATWAIDVLLDAPEEQQPDLVRARARFGGEWYGLNFYRYDWPLPRAIDMTDIGAIHDLVDFGTKAAQMDWKAVMA